MISVLRELFSEASHILSSQDSLVQSPTLTRLEATKEDPWFVASKEGASRPRSAKVSDTRRVICYERCILSQ